MKQENHNKNYFKNIIFLVIVLLALYMFIFSMHDIKDVFNVIFNIELKYVFSLFLVSTLHLLIVSLAIAIITTGLSTEIKFFDSLNIGNTEHLFNSITPFASGGQPMQGYFFMKFGVSADKTVSILVSSFIVYQTTQVVFSIVGVVLYLNRLIDLIGSQVVLVLIGFSINIIILVGIVLLSTIPKAQRLFRFIIRSLGKIKPLTNIMNKAEVKLFEFVNEFHKSVKALFKRKRVFLGSVSLRLLDLVIMNSIPIFIFSALGVNLQFSDYFFIIMMSMFAQTFMMWIPTPGASGAVEWAFTFIFIEVIAKELIVPSLLLWRFFSYYYGMMVGFVSYLILRKRGKNHENRNNNGYV